MQQDVTHLVTHWLKLYGISLSAAVLSLSRVAEKVSRSWYKLISLEKTVAQKSFISSTSN